MSDAYPTSDSGGEENPEDLLTLLYTELRRLAAARMKNEPSGHTLQATALVHEAWLRLGNPDESRWESRGHFFAAAAEAMRRILIDRARKKKRPKHGGDLDRTDFDEFAITAGVGDEQLLEVDELLDRLAEEDRPKAEVVKLKFFVGLSNAEAAEVLGVSEKTVGRHWRFAKAWLYDAIQQGEGGDLPPQKSDLRMS